MVESNVSFGMSAIKLWDKSSRVMLAQFSNEFASIFVMAFREILITVRYKSLNDCFWISWI